MVNIFNSRYEAVRQPVIQMRVILGVHPWAFSKMHKVIGGTFP